MRRVRIQTGQLTLNKKVLDLVSKNFDGELRIAKKHVPQVGYVHYVKSVEGETLGHVHKSKGQMMIEII